MNLSKFLFKNTPVEDTTVQVSPDTQAGNIIELSPLKISMNPYQPRKIFSDDSLNELASSIREFGVIQPLLVRYLGTGYELIAGERRLRASILVAMKSIPCIVREASDKEMAEIALIENLQRENLHFFEEAQGYEKLLTQFDLTQDELAKRVGKNQSTIANKLRLLKLSQSVRDVLIMGRFSERHARALLKLESEDQKLEVAKKMFESKLTVKETEVYIEQLLSAVDLKTVHIKRPTFLRIVKDARIFINTIGELVTQMNKSGLNVQVTQLQDDDYVTITMVVPKRK